MLQNPQDVLELGRKSESTYRREDTEVVPMYALIGGSGFSILDLALRNGSAVLGFDGSMRPTISSKAAARFFYVKSPFMDYPDYVPLVRENSSIFHPDLIETLHAMVGGDDVGASQIRAIGRAALMGPEAIRSIKEEADNAAAILNGLRSGDMRKVLMHRVFSLAGGWGSGSHEDVKRYATTALMTNGAVKVTHVAWALGRQAFMSLPNREARLFNTVAAMMELIRDVQTIDAGEDNAQDIVMLADLAQEPESIRHLNWQSMLRITNPRVWDLFFDRLVNSIGHSKAQPRWLRRMIKITGGMLGSPVLLEEILAAVAGQIGNTARGNSLSIRAVVEIEPNLTAKQPKALLDKDILDGLKKGNGDGLLKLMTAQDITASPTISFVINGQIKTLEELLAIPTVLTSDTAARLAQTLRAVRDELNGIHASSTESLATANTALGDSGAMKEFLELVASMTVTPSRNLAKSLLQTGQRWLQDEVLDQKSEVVARAKVLLSQISAAKIAQAQHKAVKDLLENKLHPELGVISKILSAISALGDADVTTGETLTKLGGTSQASQAALSLVSERLFATIDQLIRLGRDLGEIHYEAWQVIKGEPMTIRQIATMLQCEPDAHEIATVLARLYKHQSERATFEVLPKQQPWMKLIIAPLMDEGLLTEIQKEMGNIIPDIQIWSDPDGDGKTKGFSWLQCHGLVDRTEVVPNNWLTTVIPAMKGDLEQWASRTFVDRAFPEL